MPTKRREFLKLSLNLASGVALTGLSAHLSGCAAKTSANGNTQEFGIQLYTLRDDMPKDPKGVLKKLASFGYKQIESFEHDKLGMYWGMKNTEFKKYMDELGMKIVSSHTNIEKDFELKAAEAASIGMQYLICPWIGPQKSLDAFKKYAQKFNECGQICKKNGIGFAYHNHDYSFKLVEGKMPQDVLMMETGKDLVDYEMDIYWVVTAGQDPVEWIRKYPNRFKLFHIKDRKKNTALSDTNASTTVGTGSIDFASIIKAANAGGTKHYIIEQERYDGSTPLDAARDGATYMKSLSLTAG